MAELPQVTGAQACRAFAKFGFVLDRIRASHHILRKPGFPNVLSVPIHGNKALKKGTLRTLIRDAGISVEQFVEALK
ncbi:MAG TPA: type II toxin-antitoxin system HicA family toxin [Pirellulales bacterium]|nr:type II toxin-antitoxin system HicA family toxin [Pirellulales bacterium]